MVLRVHPAIHGNGHSERNTLIFLLRHSQARRLLFDVQRRRIRLWGDDYVMCFDGRAETGFSVAKQRTNMMKLRSALLHSYPLLLLSLQVGLSLL